MSTTFKSPNDVLYERYRDLLDFTNSLVEKSKKIVEYLQSRTLSEAITLFHYVRAMYLLETIYILSSGGYAVEAKVLLRSLLNLYVNLAWLLFQDTDARVQRFADFETVHWKLSLDSIKEHRTAPPDVTDNDLARYDKEFQAIKEKYDLRTFKDYFEWSGMSIYKMASEVEMEAYYDIVYRRLSETEHTSPSSVRDYLDDSVEGKTIVRVGPRDKDIQLVLLTAVDLYLRVRDLCSEIIQIEWDKSETENHRWEELKRKYWGQPN